MTKFLNWVVIGALAMGISLAAEAQTNSAAGADSAAQDDKDGLVIGPAELPVTYPQGPYQFVFYARGNYVPVLHWRVESGALPPGIKLDDSGTLRGAAERAGEFQFTVSVRDGGQPRQAVQKVFTIKVVDALTVSWKDPAHVTANRIDGSVEVTNMTADDIDLTFDVKAVAENGRATEIGYQRFPLKKGTVGMTLPFGETLPHGGYMIYVNVVGEVAKRNAIYREQMKTPAALQVVVGP
jgi:Putative Ig domain